MSRVPGTGRSQGVQSGLQDCGTILLPAPSGDGVCGKGRQGTFQQYEGRAYLGAYRRRAGHPDLLFIHRVSWFLSSGHAVQCIYYGTLCLWGKMVLQPWEGQRVNEGHGKQIPECSQNRKSLGQAEIVGCSRRPNQAENEHVFTSFTHQKWIP